VKRNPHAEARTSLQQHYKTKYGEDWRHKVYCGAVKQYSALGRNLPEVRGLNYESINEAREVYAFLLDAIHSIGPVEPGGEFKDLNEMIQGATGEFHCKTCNGSAAAASSSSSN